MWYIVECCMPLYDMKDNLALLCGLQFASQPNKPLGVISLNNFFCAIVEGSNDHEFTIQAYPKNLNLRAASDDERDEWVKYVRKFGIHIYESTISMSHLCIPYFFSTLMEAEKTLDIPPYIRRRHQEEKENREREKLKATASSAAYETNPAKSKESS